MSDSTGNGPQDDQPQSSSRRRTRRPSPTPTDSRRSSSRPRRSSPSASPSTASPSTASQPPQDYGQQPTGYGQPAYGQQPAYSGGSGQTYQDPDKRPGTVTAAGVITLLLSGLVLVLLALGMVALGVARDEVVDQMRDQGGLQDIDPNDIVSVLFVVFGAFIVWCIIAMVLAVFAMRRSNGARIGLVVSAALAAILSLLAIASGTSACHSSAASR